MNLKNESKKGFHNHNITELNQRKLIVLIPFQLLKFRKTISQRPTKEHFHQLQQLVEHDIMESIEANMKVGNITHDDANQLLELTGQLYQHVYAHYEELGGLDDMKPWLNGALELPMDKYRIRIDELEEEIEGAKKETEEVKKENEAVKKENEEVKKENEEMKKENEELKKQAEEATKTRPSEAELLQRIQKLEAELQSRKTT